MSNDPARKFEILVWEVKYTEVTTIALAFILHIFVMPKLELLAGNGEQDFSRQTGFASFSMLFLVAFWATYHRIRLEKARRSIAETEE